MWHLLAVDDPQTVLSSGNTVAILALMIVTLVAVILYLARKLELQTKDSTLEIRELNKLLYSEQKAHTLDYRDMSNDYREVVQGNSQNMALFGEKIEVAKGKRR